MSAPPLEQDVRVDVNAIEKSLSELWRGEKKEGDHAVTRAALWNVVAHTSSSDQHAMASETLCRASASVPQRTIVVRSNPEAAPDLASWISANCHRIGGGQQVCSEEIAIVAGGSYIDRVPPVVNALLIPDMPVAVWWIGDLPTEHASYVESLLEPADRLVVDSVYFDSPADLALVSRVAEQTTTAPADLNWVRLEEWRAAAASVFDPPQMRERLRAIRRVRVVAAAQSAFFGQSVESLLFAAWLTVQAGRVGSEGSIDYRFERQEGGEAGGVGAVEIGFEDGSSASIARDRERGVLVATVDGMVSAPESVTRSLHQNIDDLIVRQLKRSDSDRVLVRTLPVAVELARRL
ncbi:MAG: glucose-6-phosphate dehydrogenase assembly protein OpcA [Acidobacteriota bacterium]